MKQIIAFLRSNRERAGLTQAELARLMGCARDTIARIETGRQSLNIDQLVEYIRHCRIDINDFTQVLIQPPSTGFAYMLRMHSAHTLTTEVKTTFETWYQQCENQIRTEPPLIVRELPYLPYDDTQDPRDQGEAAAEQARNQWNLGAAPIDDPVGLVESLGIFIQGADLGPGNLIALTGKRMDSGQYGMLINTHPSLPIERQRFSIIHELAHLIGHRDDFCIDCGDTGKGRSKDAREIYADFFAGAFLVPESELRQALRYAESTGGGNLVTHVMRIKHYFGVSYQTILLRLQRIGRFESQRQFGLLYGKLRRQFGVTEPQPLTKPLKFRNAPQTGGRANLAFQCAA